MQLQILVIVLLFSSSLMLSGSGCPASLNSRQNDTEIQENHAETHGDHKAANTPPVEEIRSTSDLYNQLKPSVFYVLAGAEGEIMQGTAFTVDQHGLAISNYHVFENAEMATIYNEDGEEFSVTEILDEDPELDYVIFRIGQKDNFPYLLIADNIPKVGEDCFTVGNPKGLMQTFSKGYISRHWTDHIQTTTEITHGSSGGPLFDKYGKVIGVTSSGMGEANLNFALRIDRIPLYRYINTAPSASAIIEDPVQIEATERDVSSEKILVQEIIENYFKSYEDEDWRKLKSFYASRLKRYHGILNLSNEEAISALVNNRDTQEIRQTIARVRPESVSFRKLPNGNLITNFIVDVENFKKYEEKPENHAINSVMEFNPQFKIVSIYDKSIIRQ